MCYNTKCSLNTKEKPIGYCKLINNIDIDENGKCAMVQYSIDEWEDNNQ